MKKLILALLLSMAFTICTFDIYAQVAINEDSTLVPNANTELDIFSTTRGVLFPNLSSSQRNALPTPADGLIIYNRTVGMFDYYDGGGAMWNDVSRTFLTLAANPTTPNTDVGVGIGIDDPDNSAILHINADNKGVLIPKLTTAQEPAAGSSSEGMVYYNTTTHKIKYYNGTTWVALTGTPQMAANTNTGVAAGVLIGTGTVDASAKLEVRTTTGKTMLLPRMTSAQRDAIGAPAEGLLIYNTDDQQLEFFCSSSWYSLN